MKKETLYRITQLVFILSSIYIMVKHLMLHNFSQAVLGPLSLLFLLIPPIAEKILKIKLTIELKIMILLFSMFAFNFGTALYWYHRIGIYDMVMHFLSGIVFSLIGFCLYTAFDTENPVDRKKNWLLQLTYALFFSMFIAAIWEIGEYLGFVLFGNDTQHHLTTGVVDTMEDIIACFLGSILVCFDYFLYQIKNKSFFTSILVRFDQLNQKGK